MKKQLFLAVLTVGVLTACGSWRKLDSQAKVSKSIVILYENDAHCNIDGYKKLAGLRDAIARQDTAYTAVVSCGDYLQGGTPGALSHGEYIVDIMRNVGYDAITLGNHEFDYGVPHLKKVLPKVQAPIVCTNFFDYGEEQPYFAPYVIKRCGKKSVALIGVGTPESMTSEGYSFYDNDGRQLHDMKPKETFQRVQQAVDKARSEGADYVVVLAHLGEDPTDFNVNSPLLVAATRGIDAVLDGHTHNVIPCKMVKNLDGKLVPISQTGTQFENVGKLLITADGRVSTTLIPLKDISDVNTRVSATTDSVKVQMEKVTGQKLGHSDYDLVISDAEHIRLVRQAETNLGNLVTDAFRHTMRAELAVCNGGGIRNGINAGDITFGDVINALPFDNHMALIEATGADLKAMLEKCTAITPEEEGQFPQVSGMRYTIHCVSHTVSDIEVLDAATNIYQPLDLNRTYKVATTDYYMGGGMHNTLKHCKALNLSTLVAYDALADFLSSQLNGTTGTTYVKPQGRIKIVED